MYEGLGIYYYWCGVVGHRVVECSCLVAPSARKSVAKLVGNNEQTTIKNEKARDGGTSSETQIELVNELYGPWLSTSTGKRCQRLQVERGLAQSK